MREEATELGRRVYYDARDVPGIIEAAKEMFWRPYVGWRATLRVSPFASGPRYSLNLRVWARLVFDGQDDDVTRLLGAFQTFLDECRGPAAFQASVPSRHSQNEAPSPRTDRA